MIIVLSWLSARHSSVPWSVCTFCSAWPSLRAGGSRPWLLCRVAALLSVWFLGLLSVPGCSAWPPSFTCCLALNFLSMHCSSARLCPLVPNLDDVNDLVLICFVWTDTHLSTALCIVRGCIGFSGWLLGLLLGLVCFICSAWPSGVLGWASCWTWHWRTAWWPGVASSCPDCSAWCSPCSGFSAWSSSGMLWGSAWPLSVLCVPGFMDVNACLLIIFGWTDTHLATALGIVRGCIVS